MLLLVVLLPLSVLPAPPFLFPHGYFDSNKLKPFDAIYLNLLAASNIEYGGTTVEELDSLDLNRKAIPRPEEMERTREEDDGILDRTPTQSENKDTLKVREVHIDRMVPKNPFSKYRLLTYKDDPMEEENPFEEIATRAPPRSRNDFQRLRKQLRKDKKKKRRPHKRQNSKLRDRVTTTTVPPTLIPHPKIRRLSNNPYNALDISKPNIVSLPIPPDFL